MRIFLSIIALAALIGCHKSSQLSIKSELDSISRKWVPDKREGICEIEANLRSTAFVIKGETMFPEAKSEILAFLQKKGYHFIDSITLLPDTSIKKSYGVISLSVANMRTKPKHSAELASQAIMGMPVRILKQTDGWILIQTPDKYIGWTNKSSVQQMNKMEFDQWNASSRILFEQNSGYVYSTPKEDEVVCDLVAGSILKIVSETKDNYEVATADGRTGFIKKSQGKVFQQWKQSIKADSALLCSFAKSNIGLPYLWGGTSSKGLDCSGFVKTVYFLNGIILARDASLQFLHGEKIDFNKGFQQLKPGDLFFFGDDEGTSGKVTHVGMYIGNTEMIHASGKVRINSLDSSRTNFNRYLLNNLLGIRRIIGSENQEGITFVLKHNWY